jgi:opacity protein-like surface antigen
MAKRRNTLFLLTVLFAVLFNHSLKADDSKDSDRDLSFSLPIYVGLSTPNDNISQIYNTDNIYDAEKNLYDLIGDAANYGWHLGIKGVLGFNTNYSFTFGFFYHTFPNSKINVVDPETDQVLGTITTDQTLYSVDAGLHWYILNAALKLYAIGALQYNILDNGIDYQSTDNDPNNDPIPTDQNDNRVGLGVGAGLDFELIIIRALLEAKYNFINIIGKSTSEEESKNYFSLSLGIVL